MRKKKHHLYVDSQERSLILHSLVELKTNSYSRADMGTTWTN